MTVRSEAIHRLDPVCSEAIHRLSNWTVAADDREAFDRWIVCRDRWLDALQRRCGSMNTRRAYASDWSQFFAYWRSIGLMPWQVTPAHAEGWAATLYASGLSPASINRKLSALSSYYDFATRHQGLWDRANPFRIPQRAHITPYGRARFPSQAQVRELLNCIPLVTAEDWRDLAMLLGLYVTTRRVSEWLGLRWGDLYADDGAGRYFYYRQKGGQVKRQAIPEGLWHIVEHYLRRDGRLDDIRPSDYLFLPGRVHRRQAGEDLAKPIGNHSVNAILKRLGRQAGITDERCLHAHALRHAGARARHDSGADILELRDILGHRSISVTQIYTDAVLDTPQDRLGDSILAGVLPTLLRVIRP